MAPDCTQPDYAAGDYMAQAAGDYMARDNTLADLAEDCCRSPEPLADSRRRAWPEEVHTAPRRDCTTPFPCRRRQPPGVQPPPSVLAVAALPAEA
ncbi:MAG TPA: hypothetical protein VGL95_15480, partial [Acetobacteraceae bacterium]